jgi:hypothetical protein
MDRKAKSDLILAMNASELRQIRNCETSREIWMKLESIYESKGPARKATLLKQLIQHKMCEDDDVREHVAKFMDTVDKLQGMNIEINGDCCPSCCYTVYLVVLRIFDALSSPEIAYLTWKI